MEDYRVTKFEENTLEAIKSDKNSVISFILSDHPRVSNFYHWVNNQYKSDFMAAYQYKCSYCGVSVEIINRQNFEIDHFVNKKSQRFINNPRRKPNKMSNLVLSCIECNRKKDDFNIERELEYILHPDYFKIKEIFLRNSQDYSIVIGNLEGLNTIQQETIRNFYYQLDLCSYIHQLDYLLLNMRGLLKKIDAKYGEDSEESKVLLRSIDILQRKRNVYKK